MVKQEKQITIKIGPILGQMLWLLFWGTLFYPVNTWLWSGIFESLNMPWNWSAAMFMFLLSEVIAQPIIAYFKKED